MSYCESLATTESLNLLRYDPENRSRPRVVSGKELWKKLVPNTILLVLKFFRRFTKYIKKEGSDCVSESYIIVKALDW